MIEVNGTDIELSKGDTFDVVFQIENYVINKTDKIIFTVKQSCLKNSSALIKQEFENITDNTIHVLISAEDIEKIGSGTKLYDLVVETVEGRRTTLTKPSKLHLCEVVHDL